MSIYLLGIEKFETVRSFHKPRIKLLSHDPMTPTNVAHDPMTPTNVAHGPMTGARPAPSLYKPLTHELKVRTQF